MWSIPLTLSRDSVPNSIPLKIKNLFDDNDEELLPRLMIRDYRDDDFAYCAVNQGNTHKIVKI